MCEESVIMMDRYILCDEEEIRARRKDYFASLLESDQNSNTQLPGQRVEQSQDANQLDRLHREDQCRRGM